MNFTEAIEEYSGIITRICYYFSSCSEEFNDLRQDVLVNLWTGWEKFRNDAKLSTWIYRVSFNTCVSYRRKNRRWDSHKTLDEIVEPIADDIAEVSRHKELHSLLGRLRLEDRALILLWLDEKSYDEIATITGLKRNAIAMRLKRIKERLVKMSNQ